MQSLSEEILHEYNEAAEFEVGPLFELCSNTAGLVLVGGKDALGKTPAVQAYLFSVSLGGNLELKNIAQGSAVDTFSVKVDDVGPISKKNRVKGSECGSGRLLKINTVGPEAPLPAGTTAILAANYMPSGAVKPDVTTFRDQMGLKCGDWVTFDCASAVEKFQYTPEAQEELINNCASSCRMRGPQGEMLATFTSIQSKEGTEFSICDGSSGMLMATLGDALNSFQIASLYTYAAGAGSVRLQKLSTVGRSGLAQGFDVTLDSAGPGIGFVDRCHAGWQKMVVRLVEGGMQLNQKRAKGMEESEAASFLEAEPLSSTLKSGYYGGVMLVGSAISGNGDSQVSKKKLMAAMMGSNK